MRTLMRFPNKKWVMVLALPAMAAVGSIRAEAASITFANTAGQSGGLVTIGGIVQIGNNNNGGDGADGRISAVSNDGPPAGPASPITGNCGTFGCLELATGAFVGPDGSTGANDYIYSGAGSYIRIYGDATNDAGAPNRLLYSGTFDATTNIRLTFDNNCPGPNCSAQLGGTVDGGSLDAFLALYLGVPIPTDQGNQTSLFLAFGGANSNAFPTSGPPTGSATANTNSIQTFTTPDGGSTAALLGSVLVAFGMVRRRLGKG